MYKHILVPTDGSDRSQKAIADAVALAATLGAEMTALTVTSPLHSIAADTKAVVDLPGWGKSFVRDYLQGYAKELLEPAYQAAREKGVRCETVCVEHEHPYLAIIETADAKKCDLIVMASHGRRGLSAVVLGSETTKVLTHSKIPVLVHRF